MNGLKSSIPECNIMHLIKSCMQYEPHKRLSCEELLKRTCLNWKTEKHLVNLMKVDSKLRRGVILNPLKNTVYSYSAS